MASSVPRKFKLRLLDTNYDLSAVSSPIALLIGATGFSAYDPATDEFIDDLTDELADASYARKALTSWTVAENVGGHDVRLTCDPATWLALAGGEDAAAVVIADNDTAADGTSPIIAVIDTADLTSNGSDLTYTPDANDGILYA